MNATPSTKNKLTNMPDPLAPDHEKLTLEYGIKACEAIESEWFAGGKITEKTLFGGRHLWVNKMRLSNRGEEDVEDIKNHTARQKTDLGFLNLDFTPIPFSSKYTNVVRNGLSDDFYKVDVRSLDRFSLLMQEDKRLKHLTNMYAKPMLQKSKELLGVDLTHKGYVPEDEEELNLYMEIKDRPQHEIAEEILIDFVKKTNRWQEIKRTADKDNVECGIMAARVFTDANNGVMIEEVDIECLGHSYVEKNDFSDAYYFFVVDSITANDVKRESGYNDMQMRDIVKLYAIENGYDSFTDFGAMPINDILDVKIPVMRFAFKSSKEIVFKKYIDKKNNLKKVALRDSKYEVPEGAENAKMTKRLDTWYEGNYVIGSGKYLYNYKECENLAKDQMNKVIPPFIVQSVDIYKNKLRSFLSDIYQPCKQLQYKLIRLQNLIAELKPDLIEIDIDALAEINTDLKGDSKASLYKTAMSILNVKGIVFKKRVDMGEEGLKDTTAARPISSQQGSAITVLLNAIAFDLNMIREITGINPAMDGMNANDTLVGVNQMMQLAGNTATKHIVNASIAWDKRVCEAISSRIKGVFTISDAKHIQKLYEQAIGRHNIEPLEALKNRHLHEFGFVLEMIPSKQDLDELKQDLAIALQEGTIDVSDKAEIMRIARTNMKQASEYMRFVRKRNIKEKQKEVAYNQQLQSQSNIQAAQAKTQGDIQLYASKKEIDLQYEIKLSGIKLNELQEQKSIEAPIDDKKFQQQVYLESMKNMQTINLTKYKEDEKRAREKESDTRQSKLIDQRQKDKTPIDFENEFNLFQ